MSRIYDQALEAYAEAILQGFPETVRQAISRANSDLYNGPLYFDAQGDECICFDDGATPFDFVAACKVIRGAMDDVSTVYIDEDGYVTESEPQGEWIDGARPDQEEDESESDYAERCESAWCEPVPYYEFDARELRRAILGRELANTI